MKVTYKGEIVREYLLKFPHASTNAISRLLVADYPLDFNSVESARGIVRSHRGELQKSVKDLTSVRTAKERKQFMEKNFEFDTLKKNRISEYFTY